LAIAPRKGWPIENANLQALRDLGGRVELLDLKVPATASSQLRRQPNVAEIPESVWPLLLQHNLYGLSGSLC
jgi:nicotinate-nucleotide adenylyltransferase